MSPEGGSAPPHSFLRNFVSCIGIDFVVSVAAFLLKSYGPICDNSSIVVGLVVLSGVKQAKKNTPTGTVALFALNAEMH
eukprot:3781729-Amphidinium_carterae.1